MAKTITATLETHISQSVTTLATLWKITRTDGEILRLTDHDLNLTFDGEEYLAQDGYSASQIQSRDNMNVDNLEAQGLLQDSNTLLDDSRISKADLKDGKYNGAAVEIRVVNWQDTGAGSGAMILKTGTIGEVKLQKYNSYETEIRGLTQKLTQQVGEVYGSPCRANLFDDRCSNAVALDGPSREAFLEEAHVSSVTSNRVFTLPTNSASNYQFPPATAGEGSLVQVLPSGTLTLLDTEAEDGSAERPYTISNTTELEAFPDSSAFTYVLTADIDMTGRPTWDPIATFSGTFDGRGHTISNLDLDLSGSPASTGLFASVTGGTIKRLGITNATVRSGSSSFHAAPLLAIGSGSPVIEDCWSSGCTVTTDGNLAGGLISNAASITVRRCWAANTISGTVGAQVGGLIGTATNSTNNSSGTFFDSDAAGTTDTGDSNGSTALLDKEAQSRKAYTADYDFLETWKQPIVGYSAGVSTTFAAAGKTLTRGSGSWVTDGFSIGDFIWVVGGVDNADTVHEILTVTATVITVSAGDTIVDEGPVAVTIWGADAYPKITDPGRF